MPSQIYYIYVRDIALIPHDRQIPPIDRNHTPTWPLAAAPKAGTNTSIRHGTTAPTAQGPNNRQLRAVAIDFSGKEYTKNQIVFKIKYFIVPKHKNICKLENQLGRNTTAVGGLSLIHI